MVNNLFPGTDDYNCYCVYKDNVLQGSIPNIASELKADLIICGKCNHRWQSYRLGFFDWQCPKCGGKAPTRAEINRFRLVQVANGPVDQFYTFERVQNMLRFMHYHYDNNKKNENQD